MDEKKCGISNIDMFNVKIDDIGLPGRCLVLLKRYGITTIKEIVSMSTEEFTSIKDFSVNAQYRVLTRLKAFGVPEDLFKHLTDAVHTKLQALNYNICIIGDKFDDFEELANTPIEEIGIPVGCYGALKRYGINTVDDLIHLTPKEYANIRNFGRKYQQVVLTRLEELGAPTEVIEPLSVESKKFTDASI